MNNKPADREKVLTLPDSPAERLALVTKLLESLKSEAASKSKAASPASDQAQQPAADTGATSPADVSPKAQRSPLTRCQQKVLRELALGSGTKEIAYRLNRSPKTIAAHRGEIMTRLGIRCIPGLVIYALRQGLIDFAEYDRRHPVPYREPDVRDLRKNSTRNQRVRTPLRQAKPPYP